MNIIKERRESIFNAPFSEKNIFSLLRKHSRLVDATIREICDNATAIRTPLAVVATGGYGREMLAPYSDIDLLFLYAGALPEKLMGTLQATCWKAGLKLSASVRTLEECQEAYNHDTHFLTALLDRRLIWGDKDIYKTLDDSFTLPENFTALKRDEHAARQEKIMHAHDDLQPNIKEGKGGLRDVQTLYWLGGEKLLKASERETLKKAHAFIQATRCCLHTATGRADDRLSFDVQPDVAQRMGYTDKEPHIRAEKFMHGYFLHTRDVAYILLIVLAVIERGEEPHSLKSCSDILRIFHESQTHGSPLSAEHLRQARESARVDSLAWRQDRAAAKIFLEILLCKSNAESTLRRMGEAGILCALFPDFENITARMQYDMYHVFTADEHTLRAVGMLHGLENGDMAETAPLAAHLMQTVQSRRALFVAMFFHDIGKGLGGSHAGKGADIAKSVCARLDLSAEESETVIWLVEYHQLMTLTAYKRDLNDEKTIVDFVSLVQSPERLRLLTVMTAADIMAVGPGVWNSWKAGLLAALYHKAHIAMSGHLADREEDENFQTIYKKIRENSCGKASALEHLAEHAPPHFWIGASAESIAMIASAIDGKENTSVVKITPHPQQSYTEILVHAQDRKGLFSILAGAMAAAGASIAAAQIFTLANGMALDIFQVQNLNAQAYENKNFLYKMIKNALAGKINLEKEIAERQKILPKKTRLLSVAPRVIIDNTASASSTVIEVNVRDRVGLLHDIASVLTTEDLQISSAKIATFGARAVDVFYVKDIFGLKVVHEKKLREIEDALKKALIHR